MNIYLYTVPFDSGYRGQRMGAGPNSLIASGLIEGLRQRGHYLATSTVDTQIPFPTEVATSFDLYRQLAGRIIADCADGGFPLILSGNCGAALGGIAGLSGLDPAGEPPRVVWLDAHGDFNTPDTTGSGFLDGMPLATAAGLGWKTLASSLPGFRPLPPANILHLGGRDIDPEEDALMNHSGIGRLSAQQMLEDGLGKSLVAALDQLGEPGSRLYLHLDVDILDPAEVRTNPYSVPGGLSVRQTGELITKLRRRYDLRGMTVSSFEPSQDTDSRAAEAILHLINYALP